MILIDENLSDRLVTLLKDLFDDIRHVKQLGLLRTPDLNIWKHAAQHRYDAILTADADMVNLCIELGPPPKVIRIANCNFSTNEAAELIRREAIRIEDFLGSERPVLILRQP